MSILRLIPYELRKLFSARFILIFLAVMMCVNAFICYSTAEDYVIDDSLIRFEQTRRGVEKAYQLYHDDPDAFFEDYKTIVEPYSNMTQAPRSYKYSGEKGFPDYHILEITHKIVCADEYYHKKLDKLILQSEMMNSNMEYAGVDLNNYTYRYNKQVIDNYTFLNENVTLKDTKVYGWDAYFTYDSEFFVIIGAVTMIIVSIAVSDNKSGFGAIAGTCRFGRTETAVSKYVSVLAVSVIVPILISLSSLLIVGAVYGYSDITNAAQAVNALQFMPFYTSIGGALAISVGVKIAGTVIFSSVLFLLASLVKSYIFGFSIGMGFVGVSYYLSTLDVAEMGQWIYLNPWSVYSPHTFLTRYRAVNVFEYSIDLVTILLVLGTLLIVLGILFSILIYNAHKPKILQKKKFSLNIRYLIDKLISKIPVNTKIRRRSTSFTFYELFKQRWVYLALILLIVGKVYMSSSYYENPNGAWDIYYKEYLEGLEGEYSEEKMEYIKNQLAAENDIIKSEGEMVEKLSNKEITYEEYSAYASRCNAATYRIMVLESLKTRGEYLEKKLEDTGILGSFLYDTGYRKFATQGVDWLLLVFMLLFCSKFYLTEYERRSTESPMYTLIQTTGKGRGHLLLRKIIINILTITGVFLLFKGIDIYYLTKNYDLPDMSKVLFSITRYQSIESALTVMEYTVIVNILSYLGVLLLSLLVFMSSLYLKKTLLTYATLSTLVFMPYFIVQNGEIFGSYIDLTQLFDTDRLYVFSSAYHHSPMMIIAFFATVAALVSALTVFSVVKIKRGGRA